MLLLSIDHNLVAVAIVVAKKARCEKRSENHQRFYNLIRLEIFNQKMTIVDLRREIDFVFVKKKVLNILTFYILDILIYFIKTTTQGMLQPSLVKYTMVDYKHSISVLRLVCGPNFFGTKPAPKFGLVLR